MLFNWKQDRELHKREEKIVYVRKGHTQLRSNKATLIKNVVFEICAKRCVGKMD